MRKADQIIYIMTRLILILLFTVGLPVYALGCTSFVLKGGGRQYLGKNLDWHCGEGYLIFNPGGVVRRALGKGTEYFSWISRYSSITFNQFGIGFPLGGMNSAGLVIEELNAPVQGATPDRSLLLNEFQWVQYQLDNHSNIYEVINSTREIAIKPVIQNLHYIVMDRNGEVAIIEIINGEFKVYSGKEIRYPVLSNNLYGNSLNYMKNFSGFGGDLPVMERTDSQSIFVTISDQLMYHNQEIADRTFAFQLLDKVRQDDTRWSIVYDNINSVIFFKTSKSGGAIAKAFLTSNNGQGKHSTYIDLALCKGEIVLSSVLTPEINRLLFDKIEEDYRQAGTSEQKMRLLKDIFVFSSREWPVPYPAPLHSMWTNPCQGLILYPARE